MKKETIFAVLIGVIAGVGVASFMVLKAHNNQINKAKPITTINLTPTVEVKSSFTVPLEVIQPETGSMTTNKTVTIKGKAEKGSLLVIQSPIKNVVEQLDAETFTAADFPLAAGENVIRIAVYTKGSQGTPQEKELRVYNIEQ